ncbi:MAG: DUF5394 family protein [Rickettsiaceae bacterium]|nr:DUF5394 family protein [Rickettsiaceae bacterium]
MDKTSPELNNELQTIIKKISNQKDIKDIIEQIFDKSDNLDTLRTALILSISRYIKTKQEIGNQKPIEEGKKQKLSIEESKEIDQEINQFVDNALELHGLKNKKFDIDNIKARKDFKRIVAHFTIYEIYKVMNPKRIAGETKEKNYAHNLIRGGKKLASKYEGGREADLKKYGAQKVRNINKAAKRVRNSGRIGF